MKKTYFAIAFALCAAAILGIFIATAQSPTTEFKGCKVHGGPQTGIVPVYQVNHGRFLGIIDTTGSQLVLKVNTDCSSDTFPFEQILDHKVGDLQCSTTGEIAMYCVPTTIIDGKRHITAWTEKDFASINTLCGHHIFAVSNQMRAIPVEFDNGFDIVC